MSSNDTASGTASGKPYFAPPSTPFVLPGARKSGIPRWNAGLPNGAGLAADGDGRGEFLAHSHSSAAGTRDYKLYVPSSYATAGEERVPLVVMLHGCTQSPDDFAVGTRMNELAEQNGFLVVYPAQAPKANGSRCWNWFRPEDQCRGFGEPALIAGITREVASRYRIDGRRIFVAGLSAGAAMSVILGTTYPELYAAVGVHSGLPYGAAHDVPSALAAMKGMPSSVRRSRLADVATDPIPKVFMPTIVIHGDADQIVIARNGESIVEQALAGKPDTSTLHESSGESHGGRSVSRKLHVDESGAVAIEHWVLHGAGHAWSGGSPSGTFTDSMGPDASAEMIRFFYSHPRKAN